MFAIANRQAFVRYSVYINYMNNKFYVRLKECLEEKGISQDKLAKDIGVSKATVSDWINKKKQPTADNIILVANYFSVTCDYILGIEEF